MENETSVKSLSVRDHFFMKILEARIDSVRELISTRFDGEILAEIDAGFGEFRWKISEMLFNESNAPATPPAAEKPIDAPAVESSLATIETARAALND